MTNQIATQTISFYGSDLITLKVEDVIYTAIRPLVEAIGLDWASQSVKLNKNKEKFGCCDIATPTKGGIQSMLCMPIKKLNGWLFSINPEKVRSDLKEKVICYQEECFEALYNYWHFGKAERKTTVDDRTGLRNAVNMLVSKKGLLYNEAYNLVHQRFNVASIEELTSEQLPMAVEYIHKVCLEGELITEPFDEVYSATFTPKEIHELVWLLFSHNEMNGLLGHLIKPLEAIGSRYAPNVYGNHTEYKRHYTKCQPIIKKLIDELKQDRPREFEQLMHRLTA